MRTLAIGDIHGCNGALTTLLQRVAPSREDYVVFLGDYIDRGPDSKGVLETLLKLQHECRTVFLRGNHEVMMLEAVGSNFKTNQWHSFGGLETLYSYDGHYREDWASLIPEEHWKFLKRTQKFWETETNIFVHACLDPELDMADQPDWLLYWEQFERMCPHKSGKRIVCGHTCQRSGEIEDAGFAVCIDTGAALRGWLTCLDVDSNGFWQANERGQIKTGNLSAA